MIRRDKGFIFTVHGIDEEIETAVTVLELGEEIGFPLGLLHNVAEAVAAFGDAEIVERGHAGKRINCEHDVMNKAGAVDRVFAVVAGVMMAAAGIDGALPYERKALRVGVDGRRG